MLSLAKLATGQARYYLEQADGSLTRVASVSSGVEDYYLAGSEAPGVWIGTGAGALGLADKVAALPLDRVLRGEHPATGEPLGRVLAGRRPGFDLTFSAPKSVSVLFGVGDDALRAVLRDAHDRAVRDAFGYMQRQAAVTRRGPGGLHAIAGNGLVAAVFPHRTSRAGDPQLHSHVLVANLTLGADGRWSTLDGRRIYAHAQTAGYLYEARLRSLLTRELGVAWTPVRKGIADIAGVPPTVLRAFSRRRAEIEAELERCGAASAAAAEIAALKTRRGKDYRVTPEQLVPEWRERAGALGLTPEMLRELAGRERSSALDAELVEDIARRLAGPEGLTRDHATFTRRDVLRAFSERLPASADLPVPEVERLADDFLRSPRAVVLAEGQRREPLQRADGRVIPSVPAERTYTTPELLELERRILEYAVEREGVFMALARPWAIERAIEGHPSLAGEQAEMVRRLTGDGHGVAIVVGPAGSGKTCALATAREAWEASGRRVYGAALARRAAHELQDGSGIPSTSVAALLDALQRRPYSTLPLRAVFVLDEAAMIPTRALAELVDHARRLDAKLVLVGDDRQLPAIGAGGAFRGLMARLPVIELHENHRQLAPWERDALRALREGDAPEAVHRYDAAERIVTGDSAPDLRRRLVEDWWKARDPDQAVMIAQRRIDVDELDGRAHALMRAAGALGAREVTVAGAGFAVGDRALVRRNDRKLGVVNGDRGVVVAVHSARGGIELELPRGRVSLPRTYLERSTRHGRPALQHGFAEFAEDWFERRLLLGGRTGEGLSESGRADLRNILDQHLLPWFAGFPLDEIGVEEVERYAAAKRSEGRIGATYTNKTLSTLSAIFKAAVRYGRVPRNPADDVRVAAPRFRGSALDRAEAIVALLDAAAALDRAGRVPPFRRALLATLVYAGPRIDEALSLRWRDVDLARGTLTIRGRKTENAERVVDLLPVLRDELGTYAAGPGGASTGGVRLPERHRPQAQRRQREEPRPLIGGRAGQRGAGEERKCAAAGPRDPALPPPDLREHPHRVR